ncbi:hypothetical protein PR048_005011 [Dryococelus australis]|uniref:Uncharacterized protein n=1 Tax=Dryococelus australis TaxID=614101 RepID=A0ABQ9I7W2_9NEOP|nr:hypothetical protein PR048_005011 [Dryococelus australis]
MVHAKVPTAIWAHCLNHRKFWLQQTLALYCITVSVVNFIKCMACKIRVFENSICQAMVVEYSVLLYYCIHIGYQEVKSYHASLNLDENRHSGEHVVDHHNWVADPFKAEASSSFIVNEGEELIGLSSEISLKIRLEPSMEFSDY